MSARHFSGSYGEARRRFLQAARAIGAVNTRYCI